MVLIFAAVMVCVCAMVFTALDRVGHYANELDESRSREAVSGALFTFREQLSATLHDYAAWDDAADNAYRTRDVSWLDRNFGDTTAENSLFDVSVILDHSGRPVSAYSEGKKLTASLEGYVTPDVWTLFDSVRSGSGKDSMEAAGFVTTSKGIAAVAVGLIRLRSDERAAALAESRYVIFFRHLSEVTISRLSKAYVLSGLVLLPTSELASHLVPILSPTDRVIAGLSWLPRSPGDASLAQVRPLVWCAVAMIAIYMLLLFVSGNQALARLSADETAALKLAMTDRLSGLANRAGLFAGLSDLVERARTERKDVALLYLDLDGFKEVNDAYGHATGDVLIRSVSAGLRVLAGPDRVLARLGGDEFAIAFVGHDVHKAAAELCEAILDFLGEPFTMGERVAVIGCSIGLSVTKKGVVPSEELIRRADMAMYCSKEEGRGRWTLYDPSMDEEREERNLLEIDLRAAIDAQEITVVFQPIIDAKSLTIHGVEALARWNRHGVGPVSPDIFIPIAESTGLIDLLGLCVLRSACAALSAWPDLALSVNVSPGQFRDPAFVGRVAEVLKESDISPSRLTLELTETYFIQNPARARRTLELLRQTGVKVALDDFGAGFSSVGYLRQFGFDRIKLDRSLVEEVAHSGRALETLRATVALARSLDLPVTAEGVETEAQAHQLRHAGCDRLQGYLFGRPMDIEGIDALRYAGPLMSLPQSA
ncbi:bifunctional diguanylate cyclase/phosphodiesterase [Rhizobium sp. SSA_523]|uniref:putative bifunctional diguanylate cyclase/phosphodiesterase n=1 Tax=Rhizobium sp. SSA_523 TaxID=2952477 RepID=UPI0020900E0C|nr:bifunctional diguanylate cyclase/phosphodiesterase [Rhizobium sp. SSA_523]MCO5731821.1 bifunctional diguanylate cyclase/phosphodiesterase [Rhizobium sp. SSA_523]WKC22815.1 bifunctional diguanylate cyclase/phosphodiesterase [Rhizobium sp. SSA_523]